ncbi:unnamed protein product [Vicia faba]|uniref:Ribosomal protein L34Ae n=1 Tax=Vicia faba TaxID=3906 RepID=A0AAV0YRT1_VICFA|nr:unnamed protein product [Vicia faba]
MKGNMSFAFGSTRVFISNYVFYLFGLILKYFFRFLNLGDAKKDLIDSPSYVNFDDSTKIDGFSEELANFLFWSEDFHQGETDCSVFMDHVHDEKTEYSVLKEIHYGFHEGCVKTEVYRDNSVLKEIEDGLERIESEIEDEIFMESESSNFVVHEDDKENGGEDEGFGSNDQEIENGLHNDYMKLEEEKEEEIGGDSLVEIDYDVDENGRKIEEIETEYSVFSDVIEDGNKIDEKDLEVVKDDEFEIHDVNDKMDEIESELSIFGDEGFDVDGDSKMEEETEQRTEESVLVESETKTITTSKYEFSSEKDISGFVEEPMTFQFSFREFFVSPNISSISNNVHKEFSNIDSEKDIVTEKQEEKQESIHSTDNQLLGGIDSSDEDYFIFNESSVTSDSESESSSLSGLIWSNSNINKIDDSFSYHFLGSENGSEKFESEILKLMMRDERKEEHGFEVKDEQEGMKKSKEAKFEEELNESESESDEDDFEWEHEDIVEQLKLELKNSRQGGLATIIEEVEDEDEQEQEEKESPKVVQELKPMKIEVKLLEYKDQMNEIEKVHNNYAEKMRKLDILNYQTMHALGLLQLKDPLKLISIPKSTISNAIISQNLWPRKSTKITSDPFLKLVHQLHRDLELVYVGQACLSWEILCWQHMKAIELQQYDSQGPHRHRYNHVAGEFQLFQVLMQRFIENEPFQSGSRVQNYVKNRCVIRNLLHVPDIKDDSKGGEEDPIASGKLEDIIKESMRVFWEFVRADKDNGNVNVISKHIGSDLKDPSISNLLMDIRTQLQKKDKKLKDIIRTGNCIVKKFQKHHEDQLDHEQLVAQVGLRLISRVINMSQLRKEQVLWCSEKLNRIKFLSKKIVHVEPSFLLFPC